MSDNELLLAVSVLLDQKLIPVQERTRNTLCLLENNILPRLQNTVSNCRKRDWLLYKAQGGEKLHRLAFFCITVRGSHKIRGTA